MILLHLQVLGEDIVFTYLDIGREGNTVQQAWIEVRRHHLTRWGQRALPASGLWSRAQHRHQYTASRP